MKNLPILLTFCFISFAAAAQVQVNPNATQNYVHAITYKTPYTEAALGAATPGQKIETVTYFDGLGRPIQSVAVRQGGKDNLAIETDLYTHIQYDAYGREVKSYLPLPSTQNDGRFITGPVTAINNYYLANYAGEMNTTTPNPYAETRFEASPLNRVMEQGAPGLAWAVNAAADTDHTIKFDYQTNIAGEVLRYDVSLTADYTPTLVANSSYAPGTLYKTVTKDENWQPTQTYLKDHTTEEFKDLQGRVILKRTYNSTPPSGEPEGVHDTYYIYDDYGNLTYVLPPKVVTSDGVSATELAELCYQYKYDGRNRLIEKKIPGKGREYIVYNKLDQPILTQDANLQAQSKWLFTKYDAFGRVVCTGLISSASVRTTLQTEADAVVTQFESRTAAATLAGTTVYYSNTAYPTTGITELHTLNYYDDYAFDLGGLAAPPVSVYSQALLTGTQLKGLPTGSKVRVLGTANWTTTLTGYDPHKRPVWTASKNTYLGTTDFVETKLNFIGWAEEVKATHTKGGNPAIVTLETFAYDHAGKVLAQTHQINGGAVEYLAKNTYDDLGQLVVKKTGGNALSELQVVDYTYNIRGWLKAINDVANIGTVDLFAFKLGYNEGTTPLYNGNISQTQWKTRNTDSSLKTYNYTYDALNRITNATDNTGRYNLSGVNYDKNGNILTLQRQGHIDANATLFGSMDNLVYDYAGGGNKLTKVLDNGNVTYGFKDGTNVGDDFTYDQNGNMLSDANKGITNITYNHLNLPTQVFINNSEHIGNISYIYDAVGTKLKKVVTDASSLITTEYAGNYVYENSVLQFFNHAEGYFDVTNTPPSGELEGAYVYQYKDHLGNVRLSYADLDNNGAINASTEILQERNYYPFGLVQKGYNNVVNGTEFKYKTFQGQEINEELGLNWLSFKYRNYDASIGRFVTIDPLAEDYNYQSPYNFAENQVIDGFELEGLEKVDAKFGLKLNINIGGAGTNINASAAFGVSSRIGAFQPSANLSATFYNGGLGTTPLARGFQRDIVASGALTVGGGNAAPVGLNTFNPNTATGVENKFKNSGTLGTNFVFNNSGRDQQVAFAGARFGDVSLGTHNDFEAASKIGLSDAQDRFHTGGGFLSIGTNDSSFQGTLSFNVFTAQTDVPAGVLTGSSGFAQELNGGFPTNINSFSLNQGSTSFSFRSNSFTGGFSTLGKGSMFSQNAIHRLINFHLIPSDTPNTINVSGGVNTN